MSAPSFTLRRVSISSVSWTLAVALGVPLIALALVETVRSSSVALIPSFVMVAALVAGLELLPLVQGRGHDPQGVVMSTSFTFAMLFLWGLWPTVVLVALATLLDDLRARKHAWKVAFNPCQYALSVGAAWLVLRGCGLSGTLAQPLRIFHPGNVTWMVAAWLVYFAVNWVLVAAAISCDVPLRQALTDDLGNSAMMTFAVLALSPLIVILAQGPWQLIPLLAIPLLMIYRTAQIALEREHTAGHDVLTGLPNRATLRYVLDDALVARQRGGPSFALVLIDLDDFKTVNDSLGHQAGDDLLRVFAENAKAALRPGDMVARLGGDEFAVVAFGVTEDQACAIAERVREATGGAISIDGVDIRVRFSAGIAICPEHGDDAATLLRHSDVAMFQAKSRHTGVEVYSDARHAGAETRLGLIGELRGALAKPGELSLHYQPKLTLRGELLGVEALARWNHPQRGLVSPDEFIPLAERSGLMPQVTDHVVGLATAQAARWRGLGLEVPIAINVCPTDLGPHLVETLEAKLADYELPARLLQLEITERVLTDRYEEARRTIEALRAIGIGISLDDFGTGYSSLLRLNSLPVDEIKIDRAFVTGLHTDERAFGIVKALVGLAHSLGLPAIAEGVETADDQQLLQSLQCDGLQGWHIARPMPGEAVTAWIRQHLQAPRPAPQLVALDGGKPVVA